MQKKVGALASGVTSPARNVKLSSNELVFVVETCQNCKEHHWNTRHDEAKYLDFFNRGKLSTATAVVTFVFYGLLDSDDNNLFQIKTYIEYSIRCDHSASPKCCSATQLDPQELPALRPLL